MLYFTLNLLPDQIFLFVISDHYDIVYSNTLFNNETITFSQRVINVFSSTNHIFGNLIFLVFLSASASLSEEWESWWAPWRSQLKNYKLKARCILLQSLREFFYYVPKSSLNLYAWKMFLLMQFYTLRPSMVAVCRLSIVNIYKDDLLITQTCKYVFYDAQFNMITSNWLITSLTYERLNISLDTFPLMHSFRYVAH